jgi:hypothetical protein
MSEEKVEVKSFQVDYTCDECGIGKMRKSAIDVMSDPPKIHHRCTHCGAKKTFTDLRYPYITYEPVSPSPPDQYVDEGENFGA